jgi:hypothetical protein
MSDLETKIRTIAHLIDGHAVQDQNRVAVCIKGLVQGFPATLEAIYPSWPFGVMYTVETKIVVDPNNESEEDYAFKMSICPRVGKGFMGMFTKVLLFESSGTSVGDRKLQSRFNFSVDNQVLGEKFIKYPHVAEHIYALDEIAKFSEIVIKSDAGIYLAQPTSFNALAPDNCRVIFSELAQLGQTLTESF